MPQNLFLGYFFRLKQSIKTHLIDLDFKNVNLCFISNEKQSTTKHK